jgi:hypothetical protein
MADGSLAGTLTVGGLRERMVVRLAAERPGERLVAERVNEGRAMRTSFDIAPAGGGSRIAAVTDVEVPFLAQAFAREPIRRGMEEQVQAICRAAAAA